MIADFFGVEGCEPSILEYQYEEENLEEVETNLKKCEARLGTNKEKFDEFFNSRNTYNEGIISKFLKVSLIEAQELLGWYFRYELGVKIRDCIKENGSCYFEAEQ